MYLVLVNRLGSLPRNSVVSLPDHSCWLGRKTTNQTNKTSNYLPSIVTVLMRFMVKLKGISASLMITATCPSPPPGTQATHRSPNRTFFSNGKSIARPKASWNIISWVLYMLYVHHFADSHQCCLFFQDKNIWRNSLDLYCIYSNKRPQGVAICNSKNDVLEAKFGQI